MRSTIKSSVFVAVLAGLFALPFTGLSFIKYTPKDPVVMNSATVLGATTIPVMAAKPAGELNIIYQEDLVLNLNAESEQKFYNILPEDYVANDAYSIMVVVPNNVKEKGLTAEIIRSDLSYDLLVKIENPGLEFQRVELSLLVISTL